MTKRRPKLLADRGFKWRQHLAGCLLVGLIALADTTSGSSPSQTTAWRGAGARALDTDSAQVPASHPGQFDPMEPCYLANNRASESLTISESTPVGTVVGEIMVSVTGVELCDPDRVSAGLRAPLGRSVCWRALPRCSCC